MSVISTCILECFSKYKALIYSTSVKITSDFSLAPMGYGTRLTLAMLCTEINPEEKEYHSFLISGNNRKIRYYFSDVITSLCHSHCNCHTSHYSVENEVFVSPHVSTSCPLLAYIYKNITNSELNEMHCIKIYVYK